MGSRQQHLHQPLPVPAADAEAPLLIPENHNADAADDRDRGRPHEQQEQASFPWLTVIVVIFLIFNSGMAIRRSDGDPWSIAFVVFSYCNLLLLFGCLRAFEHTEQNSPRREQIKIAVWLLTTMLTAAFSYKVAAVMPFAVALLVWAMAFATVAGGYYAFFLTTEK